jgi:HK97 gp10 family phage protein
MSDVTFIPNPFLEQQWTASHEAESMLSGVGARIAESARFMAPRLTGALAVSIRVDMTTDGEDRAVEILADVPYAGYVEFGTSDTPAQPFLRPALDEVI